MPKPKKKEHILTVTVGKPPKPLNGPVTLIDYDPNWPKLFSTEAELIAAALGDAALRIEHVGSTSIPNLVAKKKIVESINGGLRGIVNLTSAADIEFTAT